MTNSRLSQTGSILIYVLIATALFGMVTFALTRQMNSSGASSTLDSSRARLKAEELITYATAARSTAEQMRTLANVLPNEFSFVMQGEAGYDTGDHTGKIFHPAGGGLNVFVPSDELFVEGSAKRGWVGQVGTNVEWSQTAGSDVILSFLDVRPEVCAAINERILKDNVVDTTTLTSEAVFIGGGVDADFEISDCASCNGRNSYCITDDAGANVFYSVIISR